MKDNQIADTFALFGLDDAKCAEFARFAQAGPLTLQPEQPADFGLDCSTLSDDGAGVIEDVLAKLA